MRRYQDEDDEEQYRFWSGIILAMPVCIVLWVMALAGAVHVARLLGWIS